MDIYFTEEQAKELLEKMPELNNKEDESIIKNLSKQFIFDHVMISHSKRRYKPLDAVVFKEGETLK